MFLDNLEVTLSCFFLLYFFALLNPCDCDYAILTKLTVLTVTFQLPEFRPCRDVDTCGRDRISRALVHTPMNIILEDESFPSLFYFIFFFLARGLLHLF
jgi:hypothetical protein